MAYDPHKALLPCALESHLSSAHVNYFRLNQAAASTHPLLGEIHSGPPAQTALGQSRQGPIEAAEKEAALRKRKEMTRQEQQQQQKQ